MKIVAYCYCDPLLEKLPEPGFWGVEVDHVYGDYGNRQQWQRLVQDAATQSIAYCLIRHLAELAETPEDIATHLTTLEELGLMVVALEQDYATPHPPSAENHSSFNRSQWQQQWTGILCQIQQYQRQQALKQGHARNRLQMLPPPGRAPYGYRRTATQYVIDKATAPIVKAFIERFLLSGSLRGSVRYLAQCYGKKIATGTGKRWLTHPVYRGDLLYQQQTIIPDTHPPLLTRLEAAQIDRLLKRNAPFAPRSASASRSLAGLVHCRRCLSPWQVATVTSRYQRQSYCYLRPKACPQQPKCSAIAYDDVLSRTIAQICQELPAAVSPQAPSPLAAKISQITAEIAQKKAILAQLPDLEQQEILDTQTRQLREFQLKTELAILQQHLDQLPPDELQRIIPAVSAPPFWHDLSETERRFYFREFIQRIEVDRQAQQWAIALVFIFQAPSRSD